MCNQRSKTIKFVLKVYNRVKFNWVNDVFLCSDEGSVLSTSACFGGTTSSSEASLGGVWLTFIRWVMEARTTCQTGSLTPHDKRAIKGKSCCRKWTWTAPELDNKHQCGIRETTEVRRWCPLNREPSCSLTPLDQHPLVESSSDGSVIPDPSDDRDESRATKRNFWGR